MELPFVSCSPSCQSRSKCPRLGPRPRRRRQGLAWTGRAASGKGSQSADRGRAGRFISGVIKLAALREESRPSARQHGGSANGERRAVPQSKQKSSAVRFCFFPVRLFFCSVSVWRDKSSEGKFWDGGAAKSHWAVQECPRTARTVRAVAALEPKRASSGPVMRRAGRPRKKEYTKWNRKPFANMINSDK